MANQPNVETINNPNAQAGIYPETAYQKILKLSMTMTMPNETERDMTIDIQLYFRHDDPRVINAGLKAMRDHIFADDHNNNEYRWGLYNELVEEAMWRSTKQAAAPELHYECVQICQVGLEAALEECKKHGLDTQDISTDICLIDTQMPGASMEIYAGDGNIAYAIAEDEDTR